MKIVVLLGKREIILPCITDCKHSHKKWKDSLEARAMLLTFSLELEISGVAIQSIHQNSENLWLLWRIAEFETVLAAFCCYDHSAKAYKEVYKISTDQKEYRKYSLYVITCWIAKIYLSINNKQSKKVS